MQGTWRRPGRARWAVWTAQVSEPGCFDRAHGNACPGPITSKFSKDICEYRAGPDIIGCNKRRESAVSANPARDGRFREILDENRRVIQLYCARRLPPADANEASADVFVVAWQKRDKIPDGDQARPWLYGIARNVVRNHARGGRRRIRLSAKALAVGEVSPADPEQQVVRRLEDRLVAEAIAQLSERDREILMLHAWEDLTAAEIAVALELSPTAAHMRLQRAVDRLAKSLQKAGYDPTISDRPRALGEGGGR